MFCLTSDALSCLFKNPELISESEELKVISYQIQCVCPPTCVFSSHAATEYLRNLLNMSSYSSLLPSYYIEPLLLCNVCLNSNDFTLSVSCSKCSFIFLIFTDLLLAQPSCKPSNDQSQCANAYFFCFSFYWILMSF